MLLQPVALQGEASDPKPLRLRATCFWGPHAQNRQIMLLRSHPEGGADKVTMIPTHNCHSDWAWQDMFVGQMRSLGDSGEEHDVERKAVLTRCARCWLGNMLPRNLVVP